MKYIFYFFCLGTLSGDFKKDIEPIFEKNCYKCHGEKKQKSDIRLDLRSSILKGGDLGEPGAVPGHPGKSTIVKLISLDADHDDIMPPKGDPLVQRVERIRGREEFLIDTLDQQYDGLARNISGPYQQWRRARLKEINAVREAERLKQKKQGEALAIGILGALAGAAVSSNSNCYGCQTAGVVIAGTAIAIAAQKAVQASEQAEAETRLRTTAMKELGESLANDVKPVVVEVEGKTVELKGTVEQKFQQWKNILDELRAREIGLPPEAPAEKKTGASTGATP